MRTIARILTASLATLSLAAPAASAQGFVSLSSDDVEGVPDDREPTTLTAFRPGWGGTTYRLGGLSVVYEPVLATTSGTGLTASVSYRSEECQEQVVVEYEQREGQPFQTMLFHFELAVANAMRECPQTASESPFVASAPGRFAQEIELFLELAQPIVRINAQGEGAVSNGTMSLSWQHDPDGSGPLKPITAQASVEVHPGETTQRASARLRNLVREMMERWPPNV